MEGGIWSEGEGGMFTGFSETIGAQVRLRLNLSFSCPHINRNHRVKMYR